MTGKGEAFKPHLFKTADYGTAGYLLARKLPWSSLEHNGQQVAKVGNP